MGPRLGLQLPGVEGRLVHHADGLLQAEDVAHEDCKSHSTLIEPLLVDGGALVDRLGGDVPDAVMLVEALERGARDVDV